MKHPFRVKHLANATSWAILKTDFHPIFYFALSFLGLVQTLLCFLDQQYLLHSILKWFDLSTYVDPRLLLYILTFPCVLCACSILIQIYWAAYDTNAHTKTPQHYFIKITTTIALVISYAMCLTLVRSAVAMTKSLQIADQVLGVVALLLYLLVIYPHSMFLFTDLSPHNNKIYAVVTFPNSFTVLHLYRPIAALMVSCDKFHYVVIPTSLLFLLLAFGLLNCPMLTWKHNKASQSLISCILWMILCRIIEIIAGQELTLLMWLIGTPIFIFFFQWLLNRRVVSIIQQKQNTVLKLKILYFLFFNKNHSFEERSIFIFAHSKICRSQACRCHKIIEKLSSPTALKQISDPPHQAPQRRVSKFIQTLAWRWGKSQQTKECKQMNQESKTVETEEQMVAWYELLIDLQNDLLGLTTLFRLQPREKHIIISKGREIILDQSQVLHHKLGQQYQSLRCLWYHQETCLKNTISLFSRVRYAIQMLKQEETACEKSKRNGFNQYASNFYDVQIQLIQFKNLLHKATFRALQFWQELASAQSDQKQIFNALRLLAKTRSEISFTRGIFMGLPNKNLRGQEQTQMLNKQVKILFEEAFCNFNAALLGSAKVNQGKMIEQEPACSIVERESFISKNAKFYNLHQKIGIATVNIQDGSDFGFIQTTNPYFWELMDRQKYAKPEINHFLMKQMQESHERKIMSFLYHNNYTLNSRPKFVLNPNNLIWQLQFSLQILPHFSQGFYAVMYLQKIESQSALLFLDNFPSIVGYNQRFQTKFLKSTKASEFSNSLTKQILSKLCSQNQVTLQLKDEGLINLTLKQIIYKQTTGQPILYCFEIPDELKDVADQVFKLPDARESRLKKNKGIQINESSLNLLEAKQPEKWDLDEKANKSQKIKGENKNELEEMEKIRQSFELLTCGKRSKSLKNWEKIAVVVLIVVGTLSLITASLSSVKYQAYTAAADAYDKLTDFTQRTAKTLYLCRKGNIASFRMDTKNLESVARQLSVLNKELTVGKQFLSVSGWKVLVPSYEIGQAGKISQEEVSFDMTLQKNLIAAFTTYIEQQKNWNFDLGSEAADGLVSSCQQALSKMVMNTLYIILPKLHLNFRSFVEEKYRKPIVLPVPLIPVCMFAVVLAIAFCSATFYLHFKILESLESSLQLLPHLHSSIAKERISLLQNYKGCHLKGFEGEQNSNKSQFEAKQTMSQMSEMSQITTRSFGVAQGSGKDAKDRKNDRVELRVERLDKTKSGLLIFLAFSPIMLILSSVVGYQAGQNAYIWGKLQLISLHNSLMENIFFINSYSYEFIYERSSFKNHSFSMSNQLAALLQNTYNLSHKIESAESRQNPDYIRFLDQLNSLSFCDILARACPQDSCKKCGASQEVFYKSKSRSEVLVLYIESARSLLTAYKSENPSSEMKHNFMADPLHQRIHQICQHLISIEKYQMKRILINFGNSLSLYKIGICLLCVAVVPISMAIRAKWANRKKQEMQEEVSVAKTIIELVTWKYLITNSSMKKLFSQKTELYRIIL